MWYRTRFALHFLLCRAFFSPVGSLLDKLRVLQLRSRILAFSPSTILEQFLGDTTLDFLKKSGFSQSMIDRFFAPFYQGIYLSSLSEQSAAMFAYVFRMFAAEPASLPSQGIGQVPIQLAESLPNNVTIELRKQVTALTQNSVTYTCLDSGEEVVIPEACVIVATDGPAAVKLLSSKIDTNVSRGSICLYFETNASPPIDKPILVLNGGGADDGPVNNMFVPSVVCPTYAPAGKTLISTTIVGTDLNTTDDELERLVKLQMAGWFGKEAVKDWNLLRIYRIPHSQTAQSPDYVFKRSVCLGGGMFVCGDHRNSPTVNGALESGTSAGEEALKFLKTLEPAPSASSVQ